MDKSHKIKTQGRRISGGPSVCRKSLAEFRCPQAAEENQPQGSLLAAQPLRPTLQTCHRHVCLRCGVGKTLCAERASNRLPHGAPAGAQRSGSGGERRRSGVSAACRFAAGGGIRSLCRRRAERSESPLAEKALAFFASLKSPSAERRRETYFARCPPFPRKREAGGFARRQRAVPAPESGG